MLTNSLGFELVFEDGFVAGEGCDFECCGVVAGFYRATPCRRGVGCGGGKIGEAIYVPTDYVCAPDGTPPGGRSVIGIDRACYQVDPSVVYRLCVPGAPPSTINCIPPGARILAPGTAVACLDSCDHPDCLSSAPRWITIRPCDPANWPEGTPLPVVPADGFVAGCIVGRTQLGVCWIADCSAVIQGELTPGTIIFGEAVDFSYTSCCACQCNGGQPAPLGCDEQFPSAPPRSCCCPIVLGDGATLTYRVTRVTRGYAPPGYFVVQTETWEGRWTKDASAPGGQTGSGTYTNRVEYVPALGCPGFQQCPPSGCVEETTAGDFREPVCPPPLAADRPCPDAAGYSWRGARTCAASWSRRLWINPDPPTCPAFAGGTVSIEIEGVFVLSGVNNRPCENGCGEGVIPVGLLGLGGLSVGPTGVVTPATVVAVGDFGTGGGDGFGLFQGGGGGGGGGGCAGCGGDGGL